jgi:hypothetical protein
MQVCKTKTYFPLEQKTDTTAQLEKSSSSPCAASVFISLSVICLLDTYTYVEMLHHLFILFLREKNRKDTNKDL